LELHDDIRVVGPHGERFDEVLTPEALTFLSQLHDTFDERRRDLLAERGERRGRIAAGEDPDFLAETKHIREDADWRIAPPAPGLDDRRVEITGPTTRSMTVNALNSGAKVWLADFELDRTRHDVEVSAADLLAVETAVGEITEAGLRANVRVSLGYLDAWLGGNGAVGCITALRSPTAVAACET
jgi:malate synthase